MSRALFSVTLLLVALVALTTAQNFGHKGLTISRPRDLQPEGLALLPNVGFFVSSLSTGKIHIVDDLSVVRLWSNNTVLEHTAGLKVDLENNRLLVANNGGYFTTRNPVKASIVSFDLVTGEVKKVWNVTDLVSAKKPKLLNDVTWDAEGNVYCTDSYNGVIYQGAVTGESNIWLQAANFLPQDRLGLGINGIQYYSNVSHTETVEYLLVARSGLTQDTSGLFRVNLKTKKTEIVRLNRGLYTGSIAGFDGVSYNERSGRLFVTSQTENAIFEFATTDDWASADLVREHHVRCTTPTSLQYVQSPYNDVYVLCANGFSEGPYTIERVKVDKINVIPFDSHSLASSVSVSFVIMMMIAFISMMMMF